ncbi:MAG: 3-deoxy-D-manno-octulosonic acid transferase [Deltaproteobacteria bacterium]|nr:3-deoxy-D-manno-octulosonic acid transferase [Deltaproteobacteria bacterium]
MERKIKPKKKNTRSIQLSEYFAFMLYNLCWSLAIPFLRTNSRIKDGFEQRLLKKELPEADLWIQAASAGEAYLAWIFVKHLKLTNSLISPLRILITSNTKQGIEILERAADDIMLSQKKKIIFISYFPFDKPAIMKKAVKKVCPKLMVLLETEIWPGLMMALKKRGCKIVIINGRLTLKSFNRYMLWQSICRRLSPDKIFAVSAQDTKRFSLLFGKEHVLTMPNMKFDSINGQSSAMDGKNHLNAFLPTGTPFIVLGSIRSEEEKQVQDIILHLLQKHPDIIIGLFPRHMHRIENWKKRLSSISIKWRLRSETDKSVSLGTVILWNVFGELGAAYETSTAAFVGGSLAPLGGQNFLEAAVCGVIPVIGPYWANFAWVGNEIFKQGLVISANNANAVADILEKKIKHPEQRDKVRKIAGSYIAERQGGTKTVCSYAEKILFPPCS